MEETLAPARQADVREARKADWEASILALARMPVASAGINSSSTDVVHWKYSSLQLHKWREDMTAADTSWHLPTCGMRTVGFAAAVRRLLRTPI